MGSNKTIKGYNDLLTKNPSLAAEWNYQLNEGLKPDSIAYQSNKVVWWKCNTCGHEWKSTVNNRNKGNSCPCCSNQVAVSGVNDLLTKNKELALDWNYEKNIDLSPEKIVPGSSKKVWWKCHSCGHEWKAMVASRNNGVGCPKCGKEKQLANYHQTKLNSKGSLAGNYPDVSKEWNYSRNSPLTPETVLAGTNRKVWWLCSTCGYEWQATIHSRSNGVGCPLCANKVVLQGTNDFATLRPDLLDEWDYSRNDVLPSDVTVGSGKKVWWICKTCGFKWQTTIVSRNSGTSCPNCYSRAQTSFPEQAIYYYLKKQYGDSINRYTEYDKKRKIELDIYIPSLGVAIEYDGSAWHNTKESLKKEAKKYSFCHSHNIILVRIKERGENVLENCKMAIADQIILCANHPNHAELNRVINEIAKYLGVTIDADCQRDSISIREQYYTQLKESSIAETHPELLVEWNYEKNQGITPNMLSSGNNKPIWWKCDKGHEWKVSVGNRISFNSGCPYCTKKRVLKGFNDLATTNPEVLSAWDFEKNTDITPYEIMAGNNKKDVWWVCKKGHHFQTKVYYYLCLSDSKCPICSGKRVITGINDLETINPQLAKEWHPTRNSMLPTQITGNSNKKVWWRCNKGHEWEASVVNRSKGTGCPYCANKKVLSGFNDLATTNPELLEEWDYSLNTIQPTSIVSGSLHKVWWKCKKCGYSWKTAPAYRIRKDGKRGCPACSHNAVNPGVNDFASLFPTEASMWNYDKNGDLTPSMVGPHSEKIVW